MQPQEIILPTSWISLEVDSSLVEPLNENITWTTLWLQPSDSEEITQLGYTQFPNYEINVYCFKPLCLWSFDMQQ